MTTEKTVYTNEILQHYLSDEELIEKSIEMARVTKEISTLEDQKKQSASHFKGLIEEKQGKQRKLADLIRDGYEMAPVECVVFRDYIASEIITIRCDTCEVVRSRDMTNAERQMHIDDALKEDEEDSGDQEMPVPEQEAEGQAATQ